MICLVPNPCSPLPALTLHPSMKSQSCSIPTVPRRYVRHLCLARTVTIVWPEEDLLYRYLNALFKALCFFEGPDPPEGFLPKLPIPIPLRFVRARASNAALTDTSQVNGVARGSLPPHHIVQAGMGRRSLLLHAARRLELREIVQRQAMRVMASRLVLGWLVLPLRSAVYVAWSASIV